VNSIKIDSLVVKKGKVSILNVERMYMHSPGIFGIVGPNGAGKSTLLKVLSGTVSDFIGEVYLNDFDMKRERLRIASLTGSIIENPSFYPYSTTHEFLTYATEMRLGRRMLDYSQVRDILYRFGLKNKADLKIRNLSTGELKRLGIAAAFAGDPEIVLLDEPSENLDIFGREMLYKLAKESMQERDQLLVLTSHDLNFVENICSEIYFLKNGNIMDNIAAQAKEINTILLAEDLPIPQLEGLNIINLKAREVEIEGDTTPFLTYAVQKNIRILEIHKKSILLEKYVQIFSDKT
jgi:ABC-2 type transport system ATP-binding protein